VSLITDHESRKNQSQTSPIRIHSISHKTNTRAPNQSPTNCHFKNHASHHFKSSKSKRRAGSNSSLITRHSSLPF
jgi:hypothetical protein